MPAGDGTEVSAPDGGAESMQCTLPVLLFLVCVHEGAAGFVSDDCADGQGMFTRPDGGRYKGSVGVYNCTRGSQYIGASDNIHGKGLKGSKDDGYPECHFADGNCQGQAVGVSDGLCSDSIAKNPAEVALKHCHALPCRKGIP